MTKLNKNSNGFTAVEIMLVVITLVIIGVSGFFIAKHVNSKKTAAATTLLTISRTNPLNQSNTPDFTVKISSPDTVNQLLADIQHLSTFTSVFGSGPVNCPLDNGVSYKLQFANPKLTATYSATGCQALTLSNASITYTTITANNSSNAFRTDLSKATHQTIDPA